MPSTPTIVFVTTPHTDPWSGAEELWALTALDLLRKGFRVAASVTRFTPLHRRLVELRARGVELWLRPPWYAWQEYPLRRVLSRGAGPMQFEVQRLIAAAKPSLAVFSEGNALPPIEMLEECVARKVPFVTLTHANKEAVWYPDPLAARYRAALAQAQRCFFVSEGNRALSEKQIGAAYENAEIVRNPVNLDRDVALPWPPLDAKGELRLACVGRLYPPAKGQDALFEALARPEWRERAWKLYLYGDGEMRGSLEWLTQRLGIADRVVFAGFAAIKDIWSANHALVMPSRFEGLPIAMVEAMLCARPVIATDVAGHREIIEEGVTGFLADAPTPGAISAALERFWDCRAAAVDIGLAGARKIRELLPADPVLVFSEKLQRIAREASGINGLGLN